jgi:hypothetical protein
MTSGCRKRCNLNSNRHWRDTIYTIEEIIRVANSLKTRRDYFNDIEGSMAKFEVVFRELKKEFEDILKDIRDSHLYFTYTSGSSFDIKPIQVSLSEKLIDNDRTIQSISLNSSEDKAPSCTEKLQLEEAIKIIVQIPSNLNLITQEDLLEMDLLFRQQHIIGDEDKEPLTTITYIPKPEAEIPRRSCWMFLLITAVVTTICCLAVIKLVLASAAKPDEQRNLN